MTGRSAPNTTAPVETPMVKPAFTSPIHSPLFFLEVSWITSIIHSVMIPPLPTPHNTLPRINTPNVGATETITAPMANHVEHMSTITPGENIMDRRPTRGAVEDTLIMYEDVNHMAFW